MYIFCYTSFSYIAGGLKLLNRTQANEDARWEVWNHSGTPECRTCHLILFDISFLMIDYFISMDYLGSEIWFGCTLKGFSSQRITPMIQFLSSLVCVCVHVCKCKRAHGKVAKHIISPPRPTLLRLICKVLSHSCEPFIDPAPKTWTRIKTQNPPRTENCNQWTSRCEARPGLDNQSR